MCWEIFRSEPWSGKKWKIFLTSILPNTSSMGVLFVSQAFEKFGKNPPSFILVRRIRRNSFSSDRNDFVENFLNFERRAYKRKEEESYGSIMLEC